MSCGCGCRLEPSSCRSEDQEWKKETCSCQCKDTSATTTCLQGGKVWDHQSCQCLCPPSDPCPEDHTHDPLTCTCVPPAVFPEIGREEREEKPEKKGEQDRGLLINWEHPVILTLASLNVLFIVIIVLLVRRNKKTCKRLREHQSRCSDEGTKNIYSPCPTVGGGQEGGKVRRVRRREEQEEEEESSETSELSSRRGGTDTSYCSYSPSPSLQPPHQSYIPSTYPIRPTAIGYSPAITTHHPHPSYSPSPLLHPVSPCQHSPHPQQQHYPAPFPNSCCNTFRVVSSPPPPSPPPSASIHSPSPLFQSESSSETSSFLRRDNHI